MGTFLRFQVLMARLKTSVYFSVAPFSLTEIRQIIRDS
jgi:hypothetical protein